MELIDVEIEVVPLRLRERCARHTCLLDLRHEHRAEEARVLLAEPPLREVDHDDLFVVHQLLEVDLVLLLPEDVAQERVREELPKLVHERDDGIRIELLGPVRELNSPEALYHVIFDILDHLLAVVAVIQEREHATHGRVWVVEERKAREAEHVLEPRRPVRAELFLHDLDQPLRQLVLERGIDIRQRIERCGVGGIRRVDDTDVPDPILRNEVEHRVDDVAVRVHKAQPVPSGDILAHQELQKLRFSDAALSDDIEVPAAIRPKYETSEASPRP